jgi:hypothetical protein
VKATRFQSANRFYMNIYTEHKKKANFFIYCLAIRAAPKKFSFARTGGSHFVYREMKKNATNIFHGTL